MRLCDRLRTWSSAVHCAPLGIAIRNPGHRWRNQRLDPLSLTWRKLLMQSGLEHVRRPAGPVKPGGRFRVK